MKQCRFRKQTHECEQEFPCEFCLIGQQIDSIELQTSAIMNLSISIDENKISTRIKRAVEDATYHNNPNPIFEGE